MGFWNWITGKRKKQGPLFQATLVEIAQNEVGVEEDGATNCGPRVNLYKSSTWMNPTQPWPWCAAFVCWCVQHALIRRGVEMTKTFKRPRTPSAFGLEEWSMSQDKTTHTKYNPKGDLKPGDIVTFTFSHTGIVAESPSGGYVKIIEGNTDEKGSRTGGKVLMKNRPLSSIRARIRFNIPD